MATRALAVYRLFTAAGNTLLQGLLEPDDVRDCFDMLDALPHRYMGFDVAKLKVRCTAHDDAPRWTLTCQQESRKIHATWIQWEKEQQDSGET
jgi:hypothetical protein